jgi:hypothetical protein
MKKKHFTQPGSHFMEKRFLKHIEFNISLRNSTELSYSWKKGQQWRTNLHKEVAKIHT